MYTASQTVVEDEQERPRKRTEHRRIQHRYGTDADRQCFLKRSSEFPRDAHVHVPQANLTPILKEDHAMCASAWIFSNCPFHHKCSQTDCIVRGKFVWFCETHAKVQHSSSKLVARAGRYKNPSLQLLAHLETGYRVCGVDIDTNSPGSVVSGKSKGARNIALARKQSGLDVEGVNRIYIWGGSRRVGG
jgi:hypothetical protein